MKRHDDIFLRHRLRTLVALLAITLLANLALSVAYANLIEALATHSGAATRTALLLNMWACALIFCSHRYPELLRRHGTRRCAATALLLSAAAISILATTDRFAWWLLAEALQGVAFGLFYVTAETWINGSYAESVRNRINALYLTVQSLGFAGGPLVVGSGVLTLTQNFAAAATAMAMASVIAATILPGSGSQAEAHAVSFRRFLGVARQLPWVVLLGVLTGALDSAAWSLLTPYLREAGFAESTAMFALAIFIWGQVLLLVPLGYVADRIGERTVLRGMAAYIVIYCIALTQSAALGSPVVLALTFFFGPACFSIYGAALSLAGKHVPPAQLATASASLVTGWCLGGFVGAVAIGAGMDAINETVFPLALLVVATGIALIVTSSIPSARSATPGVDANDRVDTAVPATRGPGSEPRRSRGALSDTDRGSYQAATRSPSRGGRQRPRASNEWHG
jgi:MFS family permease